jgi:hypothetical protein
MPCGASIVNNLRLGDAWSIHNGHWESDSFGLKCVDNAAIIIAALIWSRHIVILLICQFSFYVKDLASFKTRVALLNLLVVKSLRNFY